MALLKTSCIASRAHHYVGVTSKDEKKRKEKGVEEKFRLVTRLLFLLFEFFTSGPCFNCFCFSTSSYELGNVSPVCVLFLFLFFFAENV